MRSNYLVKNLINGLEVYSSNNQTILQACSVIGIEIPRYCFHNKLSIAGNCRMCLVEVQGSMKPVASCAQKLMPGAVVNTNSEMVRRIREGISQFLLYNHPLDCPICDQGGECDLQDQIMVYGTDKGRFYDYKRTVLDKELGPLIKTVMTRCIHCTRCVRFFDEVAGSSKLAILGRGQTMEIGNYLEEVLSSEVSGNVVDLCPVGALTLKPSAHKYRSWELRSVESIDIFDSFQSSVSINCSFSDIIRITPLHEDSLNEDWISDKVRFSYDGLLYQRLGSPLKRVGGKLVAVSWKSVVNDLSVVFSDYFKNYLLGKNVNSSFFVGNENDLESVVVLKYFANILGTSNIYTEYLGNSYLPNDFIGDFVLEKDFSNLSNYKNIFLVGFNFKLESPIFNLKLRKNYLLNNTSYFLFGDYYENIFPMRHLGFSFNSILNYFNSLSRLDDSVVLVNNRLLSNSKSYFSLFDLFSKIKKLSINFDFSIFSNYGNLTGYLNYNLNTDVYFSNYVGKGLNINYFFNTNNVNSYLSKNNLFNSINIYHGHSGNSKLFEKIDFVLPGLSFVEKKGTFVNLFNNLNRTNIVFTNPKLAKEDWKIFFVLLKNFKSSQSTFFGDVALDNFKSTDYLIKLVNKFISCHNLVNSSRVFDNEMFLSSFVGNINKNSFISNSNWDDFYKTNLVSSSSRILSNCSNNFSLKYNYYLGVK